MRNARTYHVSRFSRLRSRSKTLGYRVAFSGSRTLRRFLSKKRRGNNANARKAQNVRDVSAR